MLQPEMPERARRNSESWNRFDVALRENQLPESLCDACVCAYALCLFACSKYKRNPGNPEITL